MNISSDRLTLRSVQLSDSAQFTAMHADPQVMRFLGGPITRVESEQTLHAMINTERETGLIQFALERKSSAVLMGVCGLKPAGDFVDLSYMITPAYWGQGFALEAAQRVRAFGLDELSVTNMEAGGATENVASINILQQLNFTYREELMFNGRPAVRFYDSLAT